MTAPSFSFTLQPDPVSPPPAVPTAASPAAPTAARPPVKRGLLRPFQRDGKGGFARVSGDALRDEKLGNLLELDGFPWAPDRTANLDGLRHMNANVARAFAQADIADALARFLPELLLEHVSVEGGTRKGEPITLRVVARPAQGGSLLSGDRVLR